MSIKIKQAARLNGVVYAPNAGDEDRLEAALKALPETQRVGAARHLMATGAVEGLDDHAEGTKPSGEMGTATNAEALAAANHNRRASRKAAVSGASGGGAPSTEDVNKVQPESGKTGEGSTDAPIQKRTTGGPSRTLADSTVDRGGDTGAGANTSGRTDLGTSDGR